MSNSTFETIYNRLNPEQKRAVDTIEGAVMVMAGPGTGKTQVLATRIANILRQQDSNPQNILALTFTDAAAQNMRERVVSMIGTNGYYVGIMTFHSFASEVISNYPEKFPIEKGSEPLSDYERFEIFENLIVSSKLKVLKPLNSQLHYLNYVIKRISDLKREYITPEKFESILDAEGIELEQEIAEYWQAQNEATTQGKKAKARLSAKLTTKQKNLEKQKELLTLYTKYRAELRNRKRYDFDDMITFVVDAFEEDEELLLDYQERFQYILVDEYQDTNTAQNKIVGLLGSFWEDNPNIFVVGDPHQSIFRFQGASTENMLEFVSRYPMAEVITLKTGYRCYQEIYYAAHELITHNVLDFGIGGDAAQDTLNAALTQKLEAAKGKSTHITTYEADSEVTELLFVVEEIKKLQKNGVPLQQIAVLYRNNTDAELLKEMLEKWGLDYEISIGGNVFDDVLIQQLLLFLQAMQDLTIGRETELLFEVMQYNWLGLERVHVYKLARIAGKMRKAVGEALELPYSSIQENYGLSEAEFVHLVEFKQKVATWYNYSKNMLFHEWFSLLLSCNNSQLTQEGEPKKPNGFGFMEFVLSQPVKTDHLFAINSLFSAIKQFITTDRSFSLDDFLDRISTMREHTLSIRVQNFTVTQNRVALSTVHSAKGKEWQYVFVIGAVNKKWGNSTARDLLPLPESIVINVDVSKKEKNEDDRRLLYVALTRASKKMYLTWSKIRADGKDLLHSMFITELEQHLHSLEEKQTKKLNEQSESLLEQLLTSATQREQRYSQQEREFFAELVKEFKLSVTALNNYLADPHEFLINSLLRVPRAKTPVLSFGTAVHFTLEKFYATAQTGIVLTKQEIIQQFEYALRKEFLSENDFVDRFEHGKKVLDFYYDEVLALSGEAELPTPLFVEKFFGGTLNQTVLFDGDTQIRLSGRMDRVDVLDAQKKTVRVIDYKTGVPKSSAVVIGQSGTHDYSERELELPETIRGRLQRQMVFYKLLAQLDKTFQYTVEEVEFDFIEPGGAHKDTHIVRRFEISDTAVADLKFLIIEVMREIRALKFLEK